MPSLPPWNSSQRRSTWARDPATTLAVALGEEVLGLGVLEVRVLASGRGTGGARSAAAAPTADRPGAGGYGSLMNRSGHAGPQRLERSRPTAAQPTLRPMSRDRPRRRRRVREGAHPRAARAARGGEARTTSSPTSACSTSEAGPVVEMEGRETIMLGSNNYLGLTGDPRVKAAARDALERYGTGLTGSRLLNGTTPLHLELERELAEWMGADDAIVFTTGHQANVGLPRHDPRARRHGDLRLRRPRLDPRRLQALGGEAAPVPPQPDGRSSRRCSSARRTTAAACWWSSTASSRWRATSATCPRSSSSASGTAPG